MIASETRKIIQNERVIKNAIVFWVIIFICHQSIDSSEQIVQKNPMYQPYIIKINAFSMQKWHGSKYRLVSRVYISLLHFLEASHCHVKQDLRQYTPTPRNRYPFQSVVLHTYLLPICMSINAYGFARRTTSSTRWWKRYFNVARLSIKVPVEGKVVYALYHHHHHRIIYIYIYF